MSSHDTRLELITIPVPCTVSWADMKGDDRVRFCSQCGQHVFNLFEMTREAAESVALAQGEKRCVRFYRRPDGTVMTRDCLSVFRDTRRYLALGIALAASFVLMLIGWAGLNAFRSDNSSSYSRRLRDVEPFHTIMEWIDPSPPERELMGKVCPPSHGGIPDEEGMDGPDDEASPE